MHAYRIWTCGVCTLLQWSLAPRPWMACPLTDATASSPTKRRPAAKEQASRWKSSRATAGPLASLNVEHAISRKGAVACHIIFPTSPKSGRRTPPVASTASYASARNSVSMTSLRRLHVRPHLTSRHSDCSEDWRRWWCFTQFCTGGRMSLSSGLRGYKLCPGDVTGRGQAGRGDHPGKYYFWWLAC